MAPSKNTQDLYIQQFRELTNAAPTDAQRLLKRHGWLLEAAIEDFYIDSTAMARAYNGGTSTKRRREAQSKLEAQFAHYADSDGEISIEGTTTYFADLGLALDDVLVLPLCYYLGAPSMGRFTREGFVAGWLTLDLADTIDLQKEALPSLRTAFDSDAPARTIISLNPTADSKDTKKKSSSSSSSSGLFGKVYEFTFGFARPEGQKSLDLESSIAFWDLILPHSPTFDGKGGTFTKGQLTMWFEFLRAKTKGRAISKDTWNLFLDFTSDVNQEFSNHDEMGAWPSVIDDFVAYAQAETQAGRSAASKMDTS